MRDKNIPGTQKGSLTVIEYSHKEYSISKSGKKYSTPFYKCLCVCDKTIVVSGSALSKGSSCGCRRTSSNKSRTLDLTGKKFDRLTAVAYAGNSSWLCKCDCGNSVTVKTAHLRNGNTKSCTCMQKEKASNSMNIRLSNYRKSRGYPEDFLISDENTVQRMKFSEDLRVPIMERDSWNCQLCKDTSRDDLHVHHLVKWSENKDLRFEPTNLITLCGSCHDKVHGYNWKGPVDEDLTKELQAVAQAAREPISARGV